VIGYVGWHAVPRRIALLLTFTVVGGVIVGGTVLFIRAERAIATLPEAVGAGLAERGGAYVPLDAMSPWLVKAVIAAEDQSFWTNPGISFEGMGRALVVNVERRAFAEGGSTVTQELLRDRLLGPRKTLGRKLVEIAYALLAARRYSKTEVLTLFLNQAYFGHNAWGIDAASRTFFGLPPRKLTLPQAALLAGVLQAPTALDPFRFPIAARRRRSEVLDAMGRAGYITRDQARQANKASLGLRRSGKESPAPPIGSPFSLTERPGRGTIITNLTGVAAGLVSHLSAGGYDPRKRRGPLSKRGDCAAWVLASKDDQGPGAVVTAVPSGTAPALGSDTASVQRFGVDGKAAAGCVAPTGKLPNAGSTAAATGQCFSVA